MAAIRKVTGLSDVTVGMLKKALMLSDIIPERYSKMSVTRSTGLTKLDPYSTRKPFSISVMLPADNYYLSGYGPVTEPYVLHLAWCMLEVARHPQGQLFIIFDGENCGLGRRV